MDHTALLDKFLEALFANDRDAMRGLIAPDFVAYAPAALPYGGRYEGADGFFHLLENFAAELEIEAAEQPHRFASADGTMFVLEFKLKGKMAHSGAPFDSTLLEEWVFRDGLVREVKPHWFDIPAAAHQ